MSRSDKVVDSINEHMSAQKENADGKHASFLDEVLDNVNRSGEAQRKRQIEQDNINAHEMMIDARIDELKKELISDWAQSICKRIKSGIKEKALYSAADKNKAISGEIVGEIYDYKNITEDDLSKQSFERLEAGVKKGNRDSAFAVRDCFDSYGMQKSELFHKKLVLWLLDSNVENGEEIYTYQGRSWIFFKREKKRKRKVTRCKIYNETRMLIDEVKRIAREEGIEIQGVYFRLTYNARYDKYSDEEEDYKFACEVSMDDLIIRRPSDSYRLSGFTMNGYKTCIVGYPTMSYIFDRSSQYYSDYKENFPKRPKVVFKYSFKLV